MAQPRATLDNWRLTVTVTLKNCFSALLAWAARRASISLFLASTAAATAASPPAPCTENASA